MQPARLEIYQSCECISNIAPKHFSLDDRGDMFSFSSVSTIKAECDLSCVRDFRVSKHNLLKLTRLLDNLETFRRKRSLVVNPFGQGGFVKA